MSNIKPQVHFLALDQLAKVLSEEFGAPFLDKGHVQAFVDDNGNLDITIGTRNVILDAKFEVVAT